MAHGAPGCIHLQRPRAERGARRRLVVRLCAALLAALASAAAPADGARRGPADLDIQVVLGFSETFRPGRWTPVIVTVSNRGAELAGAIELEITEGDELSGRLFKVTHRRELALARDARKRFHFTVFLETLSRPLLVRVSSGARELARRSIDLRQKFTADHLLLVLSRDADLDYLNDTGGKGWRVLYPHPQLLPDHWLGYDAVTAVVIHGQSLEHLDTRQYEALARWIARGGTLAVSGGPDYSVLRTPRLAALLPGLPEGMSVIEDASALAAAFGLPIRASAPVHVNRVTAYRGHARVLAGGVPLVIEQARGHGRVHYLTFDVAREPFDRWPGMKEVWHALLRKAQPDAEPTPYASRSSPIPGFIASHVRGFPGHGTVLLFLALYLGILATGYRMRAPKGAARWLLPLGTWAAPLVFAPVAWALFGPLMFGGGPSASLVAVIEPLGDTGYAQLELDLGVHSSRDGPLELEYEGPEPLFRPAPPSGETGGAVSWTFSGDQRRSLAPHARRRYALHQLSGRDVIPYDLHASIEEGAPGARLILRNDSGRPLHDAWLVLAGNAWYVGSVPEDGQIEHRLDDAPFGLSSNRDEWWDVLQRHPAAAAAWDAPMTTPLIARHAARAEAGGFPGAGHALIVARTTGPLHLAGGSASWRRHEYALVLFRFAASLRSRIPGLEDFQGDPG